MNYFSFLYGYIALMYSESFSSLQGPPFNLLARFVFVHEFGSICYFVQQKRGRGWAINLTDLPERYRMHDPPVQKL